MNVRAHSRAGAPRGVRAYWRLPRDRRLRGEQNLGGPMAFDAGELVVMSPRDFLRFNGWSDEDITGHLTGAVREDYTYPRTRERLRRRQTMDPLVLEFDPDYRGGSEAVRAEGQHRAAAAMELGMKRVPVVVRRG